MRLREGRMSAWLMQFYPWLKAFHIIAVIAWMAGLLYLPRLFVYHAGVAADSAQAAMFIVMERRLYRGIMIPAASLSVLLGGLLLAVPGLVDWSSGWIYGKLVLVLGLAIMHGLMGKWRRDFAAANNRHAARFYRFMNEVPTLIMIAIVILVVVRPF
jgi:putative membrane protein